MAFTPRSRSVIAMRFALTAALLTVVGCGQPGNALLPKAPTTSAVQSSSLLTGDEPGWKGVKEDLGHFFKVNDQLYRGQQPTDKGLEELKNLGVKSVVYLHYDKKQAAHEKAIVEGLGMKFNHIPMSWITPPKKAQVAQWLAINADATQQPVFVHCQHGKDRTGALVGIYRMQHDKWTYKQSYQEMKEKGFRTYLFGLTWSVKRFANQNGGTEKPTTEELEFANAQ